jgi:hypothetical protein
MATTAHLALVILRFFVRNPPVTTIKSLWFEWILVHVNLLLVFLAVISFGAVCFERAKKESDKIKATG